MKAKGFVIFIVAAAVIVFFMSAYVVNETQQVVVTQFGKVVGKPITEPGLKFKIPFLQKATYFPKNLQDWDGDPGQIPTLEKTYICAGDRNRDLRPRQPDRAELRAHHADGHQSHARTGTSG